MSIPDPLSSPHEMSVPVATRPPSELEGRVTRRYKQLTEEFSKTQKWYYPILNFFRSIIRAFTSHYTEGYEKEIRGKWHTHIASEHLSTGMQSHEATWNTIAFLKKMDPPRQDLISQLEDARQIQESLFQGGLNAVKKNVLLTQKRIQNISVGQSLAVPSDVYGHAMMLQITRVEDQDGKKRFRVTQHNTGGGVADYHHKRISPEGKRQYQTALIFDDVSEESLCGPASHFLTDLFRLVGGEHKEGATERTEEEIRTLYQELLPQLHGTIAEPSTDERLWRHDQMGGSCATSCGLSLLRSQMTKEEFKALRALARVDVFYQTYIDMTRNQQPDLRQAYIGLDAVMRLEKSFRKQQRSLPEPFVAMRQEIEQRRAQILAQAASLPRPAVQGVAATGPLSRTGGASTLSAHMEPESEAVREREASPIQLLTKAVQILRKDHFSEEAFKEAEPLIVTLLSDSVQSHSLTEQEQKQLHALCQDLYDQGNCMKI